MTLSRGERIAKNGLAMEVAFTDFFNHGLNTEVRAYLADLGIDPLTVHSTAAYQLRSRHKTDVILKINFLDNSYRVINFSLKTWVANFNQLERSTLERFRRLYALPEDLYRLLQLFTGALDPRSYTAHSRNPKRLFLDELTPSDQTKLIAWFQDHGRAIVEMSFKGEDNRFAPDFLVVIRGGCLGEELRAHDLLSVSIDAAINKFYAHGEVKISPRGSLQIGNFTLQRKGGDNGQSSATDIQVKIKPGLLLTASA